MPPDKPKAGGGDEACAFLWPEQTPASHPSQQLLLFSPGLLLLLSPPPCCFVSVAVAAAVAGAIAEGAVQQPAPEIPAALH